MNPGDRACHVRRARIPDSSGPKGGRDGARLRKLLPRAKVSGLAASGKQAIRVTSVPAGSMVDNTVTEPPTSPRVPREPSSAGPFCV